ncbi:hypothetical protein MMC32_005286 [Xylographa parallela]|nr:hypothetical protein [Xylographa parallela]
MPNYKYEDAFYPNPNYPLGSLAPLGSYANPYPPGQGSNNPPPGSARPVALINTTLRTSTSSPEVHTWSPPAPMAASPSEPEVLFQVASGAIPGTIPPWTFGRQDSSLSPTGQVPLPDNARQNLCSASASRPAAPQPTIGYEHLTAITDDSQRHVHFSKGDTRMAYHNPQQARSGPVLILEHSNTEKSVAAAADRQHINSALQIAHRGSPTQSSDIRTRLDKERSVVRIRQPPGQPPRHDHHAFSCAPASTHPPTDRMLVEDTARIIIAQLSSLLPESQPGSRTTTRETVHHPIPIEVKRSTKTSAVIDTEFRNTEQGRPWELCEICKKKPHLVTEKRIKFCHSCYGEAVAAEKALSRRKVRER